MIFENLNFLLKYKGTIITFLFSFSILVFFFYPILKNPNQYYFSSSGDGLQTYFQVIYHTKFDTSLLRQQSINYPYGESVFFTGCLPAITNSIKIIKPIFDVSDYSVGIINFLILISIPISSVFIFLIFQQFNINWLYSSVAATGIAYLSPQIDRMGGHLALTFQFAIPALIYFLNSFYKRPSIPKSLLISLFVFLLSSQHLYFFGFAGIIYGICFFILFIKKDNSNIGKRSLLLHFAIQIIGPYLCIQLLLFFSNSAIDRTSFPWGFLVYKANSSSILFPSGQWYEGLVRSFITPENYEWEGKAYIGLIGIITFFYLLALPIKKLILRKKIILTGDTFLDILLLTSLLSLLYSFGYPFSIFESLLKYSGPIKQMRGIGRFSWIFFYTINIIGFYLIFHWTKNTNTRVRFIIYLSTMVVLFSEAYPSVSNISKAIQNRITELEDEKNITSQDLWLTKINLEKYQAILPLPYFHIGSENVTISANSDITKYSYIVSLKTGLPLYAVTASRTSLFQTYQNISLVIDNSYLPELPPLKPSKAFLIVCRKKELNAEEILLYNKSILLFKNKEYEILELYPEAVKEIYKEKKSRISNELLKENTKPLESSYTLLTFDNFRNTNTFRGTGAIEFNTDENKIIYNSNFPSFDTSKVFSFSFWMFNFKKDLYPRTSIEVSQFDSTGKRYYSYITNPLWAFKQFNKNWTLIDFPITIRNKTDTIKITLFNKDLQPNQTIIIDNLMIRPYHLNIYNSDSLYISKNNRYYAKR